MSKERWVVSELEKRYGVDITRRWLAKLANLGGIPVSDIDRLADLLDVLLTDPQDGDILQYEASSQRWKNKVAGGSSVITQVTTVLTPEMIRAASNTLIELAPAPGVGKGYIDATSLFIFPDDFTPYGGVFSLNVALGETPDGTELVFNTNVSRLHIALISGSPGDVVGDWFSGNVQEQWSGPLSLLDNCPYYLGASAAPTDGSGNITVISAMTTITLP